MDGYFLITEVNFHFLGGIQNIDFLSYIFSGNTVIMALDAYMPVLDDRRGMALLKFEGDVIQGTHAIPLYFFILFPVAVATPGKGALLCSSKATRIAAFKDSRS